MSELTNEEIRHIMWNSEMAIESRCAWCTKLAKGNICKEFNLRVHPTANRFCGRYSPE